MLFSFEDPSPLLPHDSVTLCHKCLILPTDWATDVSLRCGLKRFANHVSVKWEWEVRNTIGGNLVVWQMTSRCT